MLAIPVSLKKVEEAADLQAIMYTARKAQIIKEAFLPA